MKLSGLILPSVVQLGLASNCTEYCICSEGMQEIKLHFQLFLFLYSTKETIQCTSGELTNAPDYFPEFVNLVDIRNNFIEFFSLKKINTLDLKYVYLSNNSIEQIEDLNRHSFPELEELDLSNNKLTWLPMGMLRRMSMLQRLDLSFNSLVSLSTIRIPSSLSFASFQGNRIDNIPKRGFLDNARNLDILDLSLNKIETIRSEAFGGATNLQKLDLSSNIIVNLQNHAFSGLPYCRDLSLRDNLINDIMPNVFKGFGESVPEMPGGRNIIDLRNNELYAILDDWISVFGPATDECGEFCTKSTEILLQSNPLFCDCGLQEVRDRFGRFIGDLEHANCVNNNFQEPVTLAKFQDDACCAPELTLIIN